MTQPGMMDQNEESHMARFRITTTRTITETVEVEAESAIAANEEWQRTEKPKQADLPGEITNMAIERIPAHDA